jgi:hypothetical protein
MFDHVVQSDDPGLKSAENPARKPTLLLRCGCNEKSQEVTSWLRRTGSDKLDLKRKDVAVSQEVKSEQHKEKRAKLRKGRKQDLEDALTDFGFG